MIHYRQDYPMKCTLIKFAGRCVSGYPHITLPRFALD